MFIAQGNAPAGTVIDGTGSGGTGGVVLPIALMARGAHGNNALNGQDQNAWNPNYEHQILDSNADQQAIRNGYYYNSKPQENRVYKHDILKK